MDQRRELTRLYDALARWRWWARRLRGAPAGEGLAMHKRLLPVAAGADRPDAGGLEPWLLQKVAAAPAGPVLDVGCGLGSTVFRCARVRAGPLHGVTTSAYAVKKAREEAARLRLADRCTFAQHDYDQPFAGRFTLVFAVEALFHTPDLERTLRNVAASAQPGAVLAVCEDMVAGAAHPDAEDPDAEDPDAEDPDAEDPDADGTDADRSALREAWATPRLHSPADYRRALAAAGFVVREEIDLTSQVRAARPAALARRARRLRAAELLHVPR